MLEATPQQIGALKIYRNIFEKLGFDVIKAMDVLDTEVMMHFIKDLF